MTGCLEVNSRLYPPVQEIRWLSRASSKMYCIYNLHTSSSTTNWSISSDQSTDRIASKIAVFLYSLSNRGSFTIMVTCMHTWRISRFCTEQGLCALPYSLKAPLNVILQPGTCYFLKFIDDSEFLLCPVLRVG